jgi:uncharacterized protein (DUF934 family)
MKLIAAHAHFSLANSQNALKIANDVAPESLVDAIAATQVVELHFPKFTDGRAFSQAVLLRRRLGFKGEICATGDVLIDQLLQMQRTGFSSAVLREDQDLAHGEKLLALYAGFYQGDAQQAAPRFAAQHGALEEAAA